MGVTFVICLCFWRVHYFVIVLNQEQTYYALLYIYFISNLDQPDHKNASMKYYGNSIFSLCLPYNFILYS